MRRTALFITASLLTAGLAFAPSIAEARPPVAPPTESTFILWHRADLDSGRNPWVVQSARNGDVWFADDVATELFVYSPSTGSSREFPATKGALVSSIAEAADGGIWYNDLNGDGLFRLDPLSGVVTVHPNPMSLTALSIAPSPDGSVWFGTTEANTVGRVDPDGSVTLLDTNGSGAPTEDIVWGSDGRLWMTQFGTGFVDAFDPVVDRTASVPLPTPWARDIELGSDGAVWLASPDRVQRVSGGSASEFAIPASSGRLRAYTSAFEGGGGGVYLSDTAARLYSVDSAGVFHPVGPRGPILVHSMSVGPDGTLWTTDGASPFLRWS